MQPALNPPGSVAAAHAHMGSGPCHTGRRRWPRPGAPRSGQSRGLHGRDGGHAATLHAAAASRSLLTVVGVHVHRRRHLPRPRPARQDVHTHGSVHRRRWACAVLHRVFDLPRVLALPCLRACITWCLSVFAWCLSICLQFQCIPPVPTAHSTRAHAFTRPRQGRYKRGDVCLLKSPSHPDQVIVKRLVGSCLRALETRVQSFVRECCASTHAYCVYMHMPTCVLRMPTCVLRMPTCVLRIHAYAYMQSRTRPIFSSVY